MRDSTHTAATAGSPISRGGPTFHASKGLVRCQRAQAALCVTAPLMGWLRVHARLVTLREDRTCRSNVFVDKVVIFGCLDRHWDRPCCRMMKRAVVSISIPANQLEPRACAGRKTRRKDTPARFWDLVVIQDNIFHAVTPYFCAVRWR
jgi:hypothetical protein